LPVEYPLTSKNSPLYFQPDKNGMAKTYQVKQLLDFIDSRKEAENV
jgi:hypothetical protein